ncbi:MAG TPA: HlyD family type I secretion periplasmic adaptor subunit [Bdellovibrio sp.]|nr:HlyD family type I secretion periplasmic adaptor subunit [Bdellovibrio sp.]
MSLKLLEPKLGLQKDDSYLFKPVLAEIEEEPVSPLGKTVFWLVILTFAFFLGWSILGEIDVVVSAHGKVVPVGDVKIVQPLSTGVIRHIQVKEGDYVHKGQVLLTIDPATTEPTLESSKENLQYLEIERSRLQAVSGNGSFSGAASETQRDLYAAENQKLQRQLDAKQAAILGLKAKVETAQVEKIHVQADLATQNEKKVHLDEVKDLITRDQYQEVITKILEDQTRIKTLRYELEQLAHDIEQNQQDIAVIQASFQTETLTDLSEKEKRITELKANVAQLAFQNAHQQIVAPVDGYVHELFVHTVGGVVTPAEKLLSIVPDKAPLKIQALVEGKDIGYVKVGLPVVIKVDTFDFQKYGTLKGRVIQLPKDSFVPPQSNAKVPQAEKEPQGTMYQVEVEPLEKVLSVNGKPEPLSTGLGVTSEVKVGKRRIIEFLVYPLIKHWSEGVSVR